VNQNTHDSPSHPGLARLSFADHKLRFNSRIIQLQMSDLLSRGCVIGNFFLSNFSPSANQHTISAMLSETLRMYKLVRRRTTAIDVLISVTKNVILLRRSQLWTLYQFRSSS
jgi:hypothetical protein